MLKRISAASAAVAGALLIGAGAQAATGTHLHCDRPLSSASPANCVLQAPGSAPERVAVVTSAGEPVRSAASSERVVVVSQPAVAGAPVYIVESVQGSSLRRGEPVVIVMTEPVAVESSSRNDAFPDPSPPSSTDRIERSRSLDPSDTRDRALGRHFQPE